MNASELFKHNGQSAGVWYCAKCRHVSGMREIAEACCTPRLCACGVESIPGWTVCHKCKMKNDAAERMARFAKAEKVSEWAGPVYDPVSDEYFNCAADLIDAREGAGLDRPDWVWTCESNPAFHLDFDNIVEDCSINTPDEFWSHDIKWLKELRQAIEDFNNANASLVYWEPDYGKALVFEYECRECGKKKPADALLADQSMPGLCEECEWKLKE